MSSVTTNPTRSARRAQLVAEAVVSAYIHEIAPHEPRRQRARANHGSTEPLTTGAVRREMARRSRGRPLALPRHAGSNWRPRELAA